MIRLGLQLALRSGREALVRLLVTAAAVGGRRRRCCSACSPSYHALPGQRNRPCWSCTTGPRPCPDALARRTALAVRTTAWTSTRGRRIERARRGRRSAPQRAGACRGSPRLPRRRRVLRLAGAGRACCATVPRRPARPTGSPARWPERSATRHSTGPTTWRSSSGTRRRADWSRLPRQPGGSTADPGTRSDGRGSVHPVLPVRVRDRRARRAVAHADADQHRHPAGRGPPRRNASPRCAWSGATRRRHQRDRRRSTRW